MMIAVTKKKPQLVSVPKAEPEAVPAAPAPLPRDLVQCLPTATEIVKHLTAIGRLLPQFTRELDIARHQGAIPLARVFTVFHRLMMVFNDKLKTYATLFDQYKTLHCPEVFERDGVSHVPLDAGYRVTISYTLRAQVLPDQKDRAYEWLRENYPDVVIETVNSSTLSALARQLMTERNEELPAELFRSVNLPGTSVTRT
jgi:hypothetical protein